VKINTKLSKLLKLFLFLVLFFPVLAAAAWEQLPGGATDIGFGGGKAWIVGKNFDIRYFTGQRWKTIEGGAVGITVDSAGNPWVVNTDGEIFRYRGGWQKLPGNAIDIAAGGNSVWVIGSGQVPGGYSIHRWNGNGWDRIEGGATRIAVDPNGNPWVVNENHEIFRLVHGAWQRLPGLANDIAIGADGTPWVIGVGTVPGGNGVHRWTGNNWQDVEGGAVRIAVDGNGNPWVINIDGNIYKYLPDAIHRHHKHRDTIKLGGNVLNVELKI
jgi:hypothetical protein